MTEREPECLRGSSPAPQDPSALHKADGGGAGQAAQQEGGGGVDAASGGNSCLLEGCNDAGAAEVD